MFFYFFLYISFYFIFYLDDFKRCFIIFLYIHEFLFFFIKICFLGTFEIPEDLSPSAKDLIKHLLTIDPLQRITALSALNHPWLSKQSMMSPDMNKLRYETTILISNRPEDDIDDQVINELETFGLSKNEMIRIIVTKTHSSIATLYYLLLDNIVKKRIQQGGAKRAVCASYNHMHAYSNLNFNLLSSNSNQNQNLNQNLNQNTQNTITVQPNVPTIRPSTAVATGGHNSARKAYLYDATGASVQPNYQYVLQQHQQYSGPSIQG